MKSFILKTVLIILVPFFVSCSSESIQDENEILDLSASVSYSTLEREITNLINDHRTTLGLNTLELQNVVTGQADNHSDQMIIVGEVNHNNFGARAIYLKNEIDAIEVAENVGANYNTAEGVFNAWLNSTGHKEVIEDDFTHIGVSAKKDANGKYYYTTIYTKL